MPILDRLRALSTSTAPTPTVPKNVIKDAVCELGILAKMDRSSGDDVEDVVNILLIMRGIGVSKKRKHEPQETEAAPSSNDDEFSIFQASRHTNEQQSRCACRAPTMLTRDGDYVCSSCGVVQCKDQFGFCFEQARAPYAPPVKYDARMSNDAKSAHEVREHSFETIFDHWQYHVNVPEVTKDQVLRKCLAPQLEGKCKVNVVAAAFADYFLGELPHGDDVEQAMRTQTAITPVQLKELAPRPFACAQCDTRYSIAKAARLCCRGNPKWKDVPMAPIQRRDKPANGKSIADAAKRLGLTKPY
jgi:hypothetical protein